MFKNYIHQGDLTFGMSGKGGLWFVFVRRKDEWLEKMAVGSREEARGLLDVWLNQYGEIL